MRVMMTLLSLVLLSLLAACVTSASASAAATTTTSSSSSFSSAVTRKTQNNNLKPDNYKDDIYHCQNPFTVNWDISIGCDFETWMWKVEDLDPDAKPIICDFEIDLDNLDELADIHEPCALWWLEYGDDVQPQDPIGKFCFVLLFSHTSLFFGACSSNPI
jgi:hypothetical protein